jgi:hypothetical protein
MFPDPSIIPSLWRQAANAPQIHQTTAEQNSKYYCFYFCFLKEEFLKNTLRFRM